MKSPHKSKPVELRLLWAGHFRSDRDVTWHSHPECELVAVTQGRCRVQVGDENLAGIRGSIFVLPARTPQYQEAQGEVHTSFLGFDLPLGLFDESPRVLQFDPQDPALAWVEQLCDKGLAQPPLSHEVTQAILLALLRRLREMDKASHSQAQLHPAVRAARLHLEMHLQESHTLSGLARSVGLSASHFSALFTAQCQLSPMQYLQQLRLERACWLLASPYLRIREVAHACGYDDENYFTRLFTKKWGTPPARWREKRLSAASAKRKTSGRARSR